MKLRLEPIYEELFCHVDDFCQMFEPLWNTHLLKSGVRTRNRLSGLGLSERMTILVAFHQMGYLLELAIRSHQTSNKDRHEPRLSATANKTASTLAIEPFD